MSAESLPGKVSPLPEQATRPPPGSGWPRWSRKSPTGSRAGGGWGRCWTTRRSAATACIGHARLIPTTPARLQSVRRGRSCPEKAPPPASATGQPSGPLPVEAASKPGSAGRPTFASARPPVSMATGQAKRATDRQQGRLWPVPTRPPEPKPHGRPSRIVLAGTVIGGAVLVGLVPIGIVALVLAPSRQGSAPAAFATLPPVWTDTPAPIATPTPDTRPHDAAADTRSAGRERGGGASPRLDGRGRIPGRHSPVGRGPERKFPPTTPPTTNGR